MLGQSCSRSQSEKEKQNERNLTAVARITTIEVSDPPPITTPLTVNCQL